MPSEVMVMLVSRTRLFRISRVLKVEDVPHVRHYRQDDGSDVGHDGELGRDVEGQLASEGAMRGRVRRWVERA